MDEDPMEEDFVLTDSEEEEEEEAQGKISLPSDLLWMIYRLEIDRKTEEKARAMSLCLHKKNFRSTLAVIGRLKKTIEEGTKFWEAEAGETCPYCVGEQAIHLIKLEHNERTEMAPLRGRLGTIRALNRYTLNYEEYFGWWSRGWEGMEGGDEDWAFMENRYTDYNLP
tara:strand:- start:127 stop:630 length:504 start_codon:yes stop_codon:yes gene_type:complete